MNHLVIMNELGLLTRVRGKRTRINDITYNRDGSIADVTMRCGICRKRYVYEKDIPAACPECKDASQWQIAIRYLTS